MVFLEGVAVLDAQGVSYDRGSPALERAVLL